MPYTQQTRHLELEILSVGCANSILAASYSHQQYITKQRKDFSAGLTLISTLKGLAFHTQFDHAWLEKLKETDSMLKRKTVSWNFN